MKEVISMKIVLINLKATENIVSEITFELDRRDLRIDSLDDQTLCFTLNKDSYMFKELRSILIKNNKKNEKF